MSSWVHGNIERVSSYNLMKMGSIYDAGINEGINTVDYQLRACETKHVLRGSILRKKRDGGKGPLHLD
jgi:hypothetical protein